MMNMNALDQRTGMLVVPWAVFRALSALENRGLAGHYRVTSSSSRTLIPSGRGRGQQPLCPDWHRIGNSVKSSRPWLTTVNKSLLKRRRRKGEEKRESRKKDGKGGWKRQVRCRGRAEHVGWRNGCSPRSIHRPHLVHTVLEVSTFWRRA